MMEDEAGKTAVSSDAASQPPSSGTHVALVTRTAANGAKYPDLDQYVKDKVSRMKKRRWRAETREDRLVMRLRPDFFTVVNDQTGCWELWCKAPLHSDEYRLVHICREDDGTPAPIDERIAIRLAMFDREKGIDQRQSEKMQKEAHRKAKQALYDKRDAELAAKAEQCARFVADPHLAIGHLPSFPRIYSTPGISPGGRRVIRPN